MVSNECHHSWNWWLSMCDSEGNEHICVLYNFCDCQQPYEHIHLKEKKQVSYSV